MSDVYVRLYEHSDYQGRYMEILANAGVSEGLIDRSLINQVSSLTVPQGATVTLSDHESGYSEEFTESAAYVGDMLNDRADQFSIIGVEV